MQTPRERETATEPASAEIQPLTVATQHADDQPPAQDVATPGKDKTNSGLFKRNPPIAGEAEAIEAAKGGDPDAFSKLYALHKRRVYTLCLRMLGNVS